MDNYDEDLDQQVEGAPADDSGNYPEFKAPAGLKLEGDSGEAMVMWKRKPDGMICITSIEGHPLGSKSEEQSDPDMNYGGKLDAMAQANATG